MRPATLRSGFTIREMTVVIAVLALFFTALLPGCSNDTTAARNICRNNLKQQLLALQIHNDMHKTFPPLFFSQHPEWSIKLSPLDAAECYSWQVRLLPFMEEATLYKSITQASQDYMLPASEVKVRSSNGADVSPSSLSMSQLVCGAVSDTIAPGTSHYVALSATRLPLLLETQYDAKAMLAFKRQPEGQIVPDLRGRGHSMARMSDGTSKTAVLAESRESTRSNWYQPQQSFVVGFLPEDGTDPDSPSANYYPYYNVSTWTPNPKVDRTALNYGPTSAKPSQAYHGVKGDPLERTWGASSNHSGGIVIHGMGDASVVEVKSDIDPKVYFAAITTRGGENVGSIQSGN